MTRQNGEQPTRRLTVAELLAQHGKADAPASGRRHRRRAPEDDDALTTTGPQEIIDRIHAEQPGVDWAARRGNGHAVDPALDPLDTPTKAQPKAGGKRAKPEPPAPPAKPPPPKPTLQPPPPAAAQPAPRWQLPPERPPMERKPPAPEAAADPIADRLNGSRQAMRPVAAPPVAPVPPAPRRPMRQPEPMTDEFAAVEEDLEYDDLEYEDEYAYDADLVEDEAEPGLLTHEDDPEAPLEDGERTPGQEWLAVGAQLALGVVGGAVVWLLFNWLWNSSPPIALILALVVTAGLVWIVRNIRKAEDMQSTLLAVLVGLVVTVSPAALLLLSR